MKRQRVNDPNFLEPGTAANVQKDHPNSGSLSKGSNDTQNRQGIIVLNDLTYVLQPDLSVAVNNTYKQQFFQNTTYTDKTRAVCIWNTGSDYIDTRNSYLRLTCSIANKYPSLKSDTFQSNVAWAAYDTTDKFADGAPTFPGGNQEWAWEKDRMHNYTFGQGSAVNLIAQITISSRSGDELCRIQGVNMLNHMITKHRYTQEWCDTVYQAAGHGQVWEGDEYSFAIPLYILTDFFGYGRLLPSMVASGLRIEIDWENPNIAFHAISAVPQRQVHATKTSSVGTGATKTIHLGVMYDEITDLKYDNVSPDVPNAQHVVSNQFSVLTGYDIKDIYFDLKSVQLTDATQRALNEISAVNGLELVYTDYERTQQALDGTFLHMEVRKSCSRAMAAYARITQNIDRAKEYAKSWWADPAKSGKAKMLYFGEFKDDAYSSNLPRFLKLSSTEYKHGTTSLAGGLAQYLGEINRDSFASLPWDVTNYQWQLGSLYFPNQPVASQNSTTDPSDILPTTYVNMLDTFNNYNGLNKCSSVRFNSHRSNLITNHDVPLTSLPEHANNTGLATAHVSNSNAHQLSAIKSNYLWLDPFNYNSGHHGMHDTFCNGQTTIAVKLERSNLFNLTGVPVNNSRVLATRIQFKDVDRQGRMVTCFLKYVKLTRCFLNNIEVEQ